MMSAILPETDRAIKTHKAGRRTPKSTLTGLGAGDEAAANSCEESIVIHIGQHGITSTDIIARESATEERLRDILRAVGPLLKQLHEALNAYSCKYLEVTH